VRTTLEPISRGCAARTAARRGPIGSSTSRFAIPRWLGAFLVETCRQLGAALVEAWLAHGEGTAIPSDEDEVVFARRLIAQRCLYGVDRNPWR